MSALGKAPKNSPRQAQGRPGSGFSGSTTITFAPSTWKSCRTKPSQRLSMPGNGLASSAGADAIRSVPRIDDEKVIQGFLADRNRQHIQPTRALSGTKSAKAIIRISVSDPVEQRENTPGGASSIHQPGESSQPKSIAARCSTLSRAASRRANQTIRSIQVRTAGTPHRLS